MARGPERDDRGAHGGHSCYTSNVDRHAVVSRHIAARKEHIRAALRGLSPEHWCNHIQYSLVTHYLRDLDERYCAVHRVKLLDALYLSGGGFCIEVTLQHHREKLYLDPARALQHDRCLFEIQSKNVLPALDPARLSHLIESLPHELCVEQGRALDIALHPVCTGTFLALRTMLCLPTQQLSQWCDEHLLTLEEEDMADRAAVSWETSMSREANSFS